MSKKDPFNPRSYDSETHVAMLVCTHAMEHPERDPANDMVDVVELEPQADGTEKEVVVGQARRVYTCDNADGEQDVIVLSKRVAFHSFANGLVGPLDGEPVPTDPDAPPPAPATQTEAA